MNLVLIIWSMVASACLTLAAMHLLVWWKRRTAWANLLFSLAAIATAAMGGCEVWMMQAETPAQFATALRWIHVPIWVVIVALTGFVLIYLQAGRLWLAWLVITLRTCVLLLNFLVEQNFYFLELTNLRPIPFLGGTVSTPEGILNPILYTGPVSMLAFWIFLADATRTVWRRGDRRQAMVVGGSFIFFALTSTIQGSLAIQQIINQPVMLSLFFMGVIAAMASEMARTTVQAAQLSDDLSKNETWLNLTADSIDVGLWLWDFKTNLIWATEKSRQLYGFSTDEQISFEAFLSRLHPDDRDWVIQASQQSLHEGADFRYDYRVVLPDGRLRWFRVLAKPFFGPSGASKRMSGISIDITLQKQMEMELQQKRNELTHVCRVSTMGQLASTLAHELNQPLGAILRNAEAAELFLQDPSPDLDEVRAILADICKDDQRAGKVIDRMRAMMKQRQTELSRLDLTFMTREVITLVKSDAEKRQVRLAVDIPLTLPPVHGDRVQLQQVLINLLLNALDALDSNHRAKPQVTVAAKTADAAVEIAVSDNGSGIAEDQLGHVFEPFFSTKHDGLGMGLAISRTIIEAHGGQLWAETNGVGGATFTLSLPIAKDGDIG